MTTVAELMTPEVVTIRNSARVSEAIALMQQRAVQALIVERLNDSDAYGIVTAGDVVGKIVALGRDPARVRVYEIMTKPCVVLNPNLEIEQAASLLTRLRLHSAPVIQSELLGILSVTDILKRTDLDSRPQVLALADKIQQASATAREICQEQGPGSANCADAWAVVDTLQAELARQQAKPIEKVASEVYWEEYPESFKDREYEQWCSG